MADKIETHYVTRITVEKVVRTIPGPPQYSTDKQKAPTREVTELANLAVKGNDLNDLKSKITSHVSLVEDFDGSDPVSRPTR